jgi:DnaK suppressor protein
MNNDRARELLQKERARIEGALAKLGSTGDTDPATNPSDDATNLHDRELEAGLEEGLRTDLDAIERAEKRIEDGTYGVSVESGEKIPDGRLEALPWAERTAEEDEHHQGHG